MYLRERTTESSKSRRGWFFFFFLSFSPSSCSAELGRWIGPPGTLPCAQPDTGTTSGVPRDLPGVEEGLGLRARPQPHLAPPLGGGGVWLGTQGKREGASSRFGFLGCQDPDRTQVAARPRGACTWRPARPPVSAPGMGRLTPGKLLLPTSFTC